MNSKRISLIHRVTAQEWDRLIYVQCFCRGIRRFSRRKWKVYPTWKDIYDRYKDMLGGIKQRDLQEINQYIFRNNMDWSSHRVRELLDLEQMPVRTIEE